MGERSLHFSVGKFVRTMSIKLSNGIEILEHNTVFFFYKQNQGAVI